MAGEAGARARVGGHEVSYDEETGIFHLVNSESMNASDAQGLDEFFMKHMQKPPFLLLGDSRRFRRLTSDGRTQISKSQVLRTGGYVAMCGAPPATRVLMAMISKALELTSTSSFKLKSVADEAEGRAWLMEMRQAHLARVRA